MSEPGSLGVQLDRAFDINEKWSMYPLIRMAWVHEFQTSRSINASLQALPTANWTVNGASAAPNSANVGISFQAMNKNGLAFFASGDVDASSTTQSYMGQVGFKLLW
jgi:outer membrane autotransporter protein